MDAITDAEKLLQLEEQLNRIEKMMDNFMERAPVIDALGRVLIRHKTVSERSGIDPTTISKNKNIPKLEEIGHRRVFIEIGDVAVVRKDSRRK